MRQGQHKNRSRGRGNQRRPGNSTNRVYESNGPDVKVRGTAQTVAEKYQQLARDATSSGEFIMSESYYQHAEHYLRIIAANQSAIQQQQQQQQQQRMHDAADDTSPASAPGTGPQPVDTSVTAAAEPSSKPDDAKANGGAAQSDQLSAQKDAASFDSELPQFLKTPIEDTEDAAKPKPKKRSSSRSKAAKPENDASKAGAEDSAQPADGDDAPADPATDAEAVAS